MRTWWKRNASPDAGWGVTSRTSPFRLSATRRESAPHHRGTLQERELARLEAVEAAREQRLERRWDRVGLAVLGRVRQELLEKEGVTLGRADDVRTKLVRNLGEVVDQRLAGLAGERSEPRSLGFE